MKDIAILILVAILAFLVWNSRVTGTYTASPMGIPVDTAAAIPPEITGAIIEKFQSENPDLYPIETLFVNPQNDNVFDSRFMFFNTKHFYGAQYDIQARVDEDGSVKILKKTETATSDPGYGYVPDKYQPWSGIQGTLDAQLKKEMSTPIPEPNLDNLAQAYKQNMTVTQQNLQMRE